jgi:hypothetical protein
MYARVCMHTCMYIRVCMYMCVRIHAGCTHTCMYVRVCTHICMYVRDVHVLMRTHVCIGMLRYIISNYAYIHPQFPIQYIHACIHAQCLSPDLFGCACEAPLSHSCSGSESDEGHRKALPSAHVHGSAHCLPAVPEGSLLSLLLTWLTMAHEFCVNSLLWHGSAHSAAD